MTVFQHRLSVWIGGVLRFGIGFWLGCGGEDGVRRRLSSDPGFRVRNFSLVTGCYKSAGKKGKVLPLFADKLISMDFRPLEEAWLWLVFLR